MKKQLYMHLIDGRPAEYYPGEQICYAATGRYSRTGIQRLATSIEQIKKEQKLSEKWRLSRGFPPVIARDYSYVRIGKGAFKC